MALIFEDRCYHCGTITKQLFVSNDEKILIDGKSVFMPAKSCMCIECHTFIMRPLIEVYNILGLQNNNNLP
jgi:hypothetical protein